MSQENHAVQFWDVFIG